MKSKLIKSNKLIFDLQSQAQKQPKNQKTKAVELIPFHFIHAMISMYEMLQGICKLSMDKNLIILSIVPN